jgi:phosphoesterase RecJ-like protein
MSAGETLQERSGRDKAFTSTKRDDMSLEIITSFLHTQAHDHFLITSHHNPDADGIAAMLAFGKILQFLGKRYALVIDGAPPRQLSFLPDFATIHVYNEVRLAFTPAIVVTLDCTDLNRIGKVNTFLKEHITVLNIDHHPGNTRFGVLNLVDPDASSATELLYSLCKRLQVPIDAPLATQLYTGILFDTGRFRYSRTSSQTFRICAELLEQSKMDLQTVAEKLYYENSLATMKLLSVALDRLQTYAEGKIVVTTLDYKTLSRPEFRDADTEGFVDYTMAIQGVEVGVFLREYEREKIRISLRARNHFDVQAVAALWGGGGHKKAAGCRQEGPLEVVTTHVLQEIQQRLAAV